VSAPVGVRTDVLDLQIDPVGAVVSRAVLTREREAADWAAEGLAGFITRSVPKEPKPIVLFDRSVQRDYVAESGVVVAGAVAAPNHKTTVFTREPGPVALADGQDSLKVSFVAEAGGVRLRKTYELHRGSYAIDVTHEVTNLGDAPIAPMLYLQLKRDNGKVGDESRFYSTYTGPAVYTDSDHYHKVSFEDIAKHEAFAPKPGNSGWLAMVQHYFISAWIPQGDGNRSLYTDEISPTVFSVGAKLPLGDVAAGASVLKSAVLYVGPQDQGTLEKLAPGLDRVADYGWLDPIAKPLFWLLGYLYRLFGNWGWAIVGLTVLIKVAFYPLASAGFRSMARMKEVTPRIQALKEKFGDDKQGMQVAMMELYKREKINPLGGCLPMLIPIPVFIALYWVLLGSVEIRNSPWVGWIHDLSSPDPWFILPTIMMISSWVQFKLQPTPADPMQAKMMMIMPLVFGVMFFFFPSGLVLYYVLNTGLSMLQQWRINQLMAKSKAMG
jgi:YidC/Oxa1 family membrane protein insertase